MSEMADYVRVAGVGDVPEGSMKGFKVGPDRILICHTSEGYFALVDECSHDSAPISDGQIEGQEVVCARHGARFDLRTGGVTAPPAIAPVDTYEVKVDGDDILVLLD
jgi:3-phenylpropionate/trans-cinnamate dioxygenase ferredoxin subunit